MIATRAAMGTLVRIETVRDGEAEARSMDRAFAWFGDVEACCSRFEPESELMRLCRRPGRPVAVSALLGEALRTALAVAEASQGAFDPTLGAAMVAAGYDRNWKTGARVPASGVAEGTWRDVELDPAARCVTLHRPVQLDLGAVAKGLALDLAARELAPLHDFAVDAGGDLFLGGHNSVGQPWRVGLRHPRAAVGGPEPLVDTLAISDAAVCTSGDYERGPHLRDPRQPGAPAAVRACSATVVAAQAIAADALSTAALVLGPEAGLRLLEREGVAGLVLTSTLARHATPGWPGPLADLAA